MKTVDKGWNNVRVLIGLKGYRPLGPDPKSFDLDPEYMGESLNKLTRDDCGFEAHCKNCLVYAACDWKQFIELDPEEGDVIFTCPNSNIK